MKPIIFRDDAILELLGGVSHYDEARLGWGERFRDSANGVIALIARFPKLGARVTRSGGREFVMTDFPYSVIYVINDDAIEIVAIAHNKRRRGYWKSRLKRS